jgi:uncharacterized protein YlxW (UPF0749 family)
MSTKIKIISIITGIFVGLLITAQFLNLTPSSSSFPLDQLEAQEDLINSYTNDQALLASRIVSLREKIDKAQEKSKLISQTANLDVLSVLKEKVGLEVKKGVGYEITLNDGGGEQGIVYASDLRDLLNLIRTSGAEALAINNQRVINTTSINSVGNTILVGSFNLVPPFTISVIGDADVFNQYYNDSVMIDDLKKRIANNAIEYSMKKLDLISLPIYNGQLRLNHITAEDDNS